ncbi:MAG: M23 family metallopeptidase [Luteimonas sp.]|nr:M23 family metallopeptidase [Luteimonas sp.]
MRRLLACASLLLLLVPAITCAQSGRIYRWSDLNGTTHYGDRADADARQAQGVEIPIHIEPAAVARLRIEPRGDNQLAWIDNALAGPIEVMLHAASPRPIASDPPLPARATVPARQAALVAVLGAGPAGLRVEAVPGTPNARPRNVEYAYPLGNAPLRVQQAWGGQWSHADAENRHAVDFAADIGTPVLAARDGVVMQTEGGFDDADPDDPDAQSRANFIRILHDDGTMALYAHLRPGGVHVRVGQHVRRGQAIGLSGNTGRSTAPHLHFVVQANRGMRLESVPFRMFGPQGILRFGLSGGAGD